MWEQEIYVEFLYKNPKIGFHSFEAENSLAGLSFADDRSVFLSSSSSGEGHFPSLTINKRKGFFEKRSVFSVMK